jgi:hypothetical protein
LSADVLRCRVYECVVLPIHHLCGSGSVTGDGLEVGIFQTDADWLTGEGYEGEKT